jgi:hypothetical protein
MPYAETLPAAETGELAANVNTSTINTARNKAIFLLLLQASLFLNVIVLLRMVISLSTSYMVSFLAVRIMFMPLPQLMVMRFYFAPGFVMSRGPVDHHLRHHEIVGLPDMLSALGATLPDHCFRIIRHDYCRAFRADDPKLRHILPFILNCSLAFTSR